MRLQRKISKYLEYIVNRGINPRPKQPIEIITSSYIPDVLEGIIEALKGRDVGEITITYIDGKKLEEEINRDPLGLIEKRIKMYESLIEAKFARITLLSPFLFPLARTDSIDAYKANSKRLYFVNDYFNSKLSQHTIAAIANPYWAFKLELSLDELWDKIIVMNEERHTLALALKNIEELRLDSMLFETSLGTRLRVGLIPGARLLSNVHKTIDNISYEPNIPSVEIYTSPNKYEVDGVLVLSRPLYYQGLFIRKGRLEFKAGRVINSYGLDEILGLDEGLFYAGEIALVIPHDDTIYYNTLMDENMGAHLALGEGFSEDICSELVNRCRYHIDLVFGTNDINVTGYSNNKAYELLKNGKFVLGEK